MQGGYIGYVAPIAQVWERPHGRHSVSITLYNVSVTLNGSDQAS